MKPKWTPGPWFVFTHDDAPKSEREWYIENVEGDYVAREFISRADADLAASAPALYGALEDVVRRVETQSLRDAAVLYRAQSVLAKARGES